MEQPSFSEISEPIYQKTRNYLPKHMALHLKSQSSDYITLSDITSKVHTTTIMLVPVQVTSHQSFQLGLFYDPNVPKVLHASVVR